MSTAMHPHTGTRTTIVAILTSVFLLGGGSALQNSAIVLRGSLEGFSDLAIGLISSGYFAGMLMGSFLAIAVIRRVGYVRTFAAFASLASASALAHILIINPTAWVVLRFSHGVSFSVVLVVVESWLNVASSNAYRGRIFSIYSLVFLASMGIVQPLLGVFPPSRFEIFGITSILVSLCLLPITLMNVQGVATIGDARVRVGGVMRKSPMGTLGVVASGLVAGAHMSLAPRFAQNLGLPVRSIGLFLLIFSLGTVVMQWPLGIVSDRFGRRAALLTSSLVGVAAALGLSASTGPGLWMTVMAFFFGGFAMPLYSLAITTVNDQLLPEDMVQSASALYVFYGVGSMTGPLAASAVMESLGAQALYLTIALILAVYAAFGVAWIHRVPGFLVRGKTASYQTYPRTSLFALQQLGRRAIRKPSKNSGGRDEQRGNTAADGTPAEGTPP